VACPLGDAVLRRLQKCHSNSLNVVECDAVAAKFRCPQLYGNAHFAYTRHIEQVEWIDNDGRTHARVRLGPDLSIVIVQLAAQGNDE
jgi:hypothetical protein